MKNVKVELQIGDTVALLSPRSGASLEYRKGAFIAIIGTLIACGYDFGTAMWLVCQQAGMMSEHFPILLTDLTEIAPTEWAWEIRKYYE